MKVIVLGSVLMSLFSCGIKNTSDATISESPPPRKAMVVSMSGYTTCRADEGHHNGEPGPMGTAFYARAAAVSETIREKTGLTPDIFASCYNADKELITSSTLNPVEAKVYFDLDYLKELRSVMASYTDIYVVGHSYGGWLAMKLVERWEGSPESIKALYTFDPISRELCFFDRPEYCMSAPKDILAIGRQHIRENTGVWINPWQDETFFLHSSAIPQADENPKHEVEHFNIDSVQSIWDNLKSRISG
jgi:hypothetical protein